MEGGWVPAYPLYADEPVGVVCVCPTDTHGAFFMQNDLLALAAKYVWWNPPEVVVANQLDKLTANVMEMGTWEDANALLARIGPDRFLAILESPPPGGISSKSLAFWHHRFGLPGAPPRATKRSFQ
jgi:hypothetical protein